MAEALDALPGEVFACIGKRQRGVDSPPVFKVVYEFLLSLGLCVAMASSRPVKADDADA